MNLFSSIMGWWRKYVCFKAVVVGQEKCTRQTSSQAVTESEEGGQGQALTPRGTASLQTPAVQLISLRRIGPSSVT